jgi:DNA polymerase III delta prime subunit
MTIKEIVEINNPNESKFKVMKEKQNIFVPDINNLNISRRNGMVYVLAGSGGSGKTNLLLNLFKSKDCYRNKFHNIYYFCPEASFASLENHPFQNHPRTYHELDVPILEGIYQELVSYKVDDKLEKKKDKKKKKNKYDENDNDFSSEEDEEKEIQYSAIIIDDMADILKQKDIQKQLNKMIIKARHLQLSFIFTLQSYLYMPRQIRKQITYTSIFKPKSIAEWNSITQELLHLNKDDALILYNFVYDKPYTHLDLDTVTNTLYKNFNLLELKN